MCHLRGEVVRRVDAIATGNGDRVDSPARVRPPSAERMSHSEGPRVGVGDVRHRERGQHNDESSSYSVDGRGKKRSNPESKAASQGRSCGGSTEKDGVVDLDVTSPGAYVVGEVRPKMSSVSTGLVHGLASGATGDSGGEALRARFPGDGGLTRPARGLVTGSGEPAGDEDLLRARHNGVGGVKHSLSSMQGSEGRSVRDDITRAKAVRFLLTDAVDTNPPSIPGTASRKASKEREHPSFLEAVDITDWVCMVCDRRNGGGADRCTTCGRCRCVPRATRGALSSSQGTTTSVAKEKVREFEGQGYVSARGDRSGSSVRQAQVLSSGGSKRDAMRETMRSNRGAYDFASFARMRQTTQPAAKERLSLTREIKSLLTVIRGGGGQL